MSHSVGRWGYRAAWRAAQRKLAVCTSRGANVVKTLVVCVTCTGVSLAAVCRAASPPSMSLLQSELATGEFSSAIETAKQLPPQLRDQALGLVAAAQYQAGARQASFTTIAFVQDDRQRAAALSGFDSPSAKKKGSFGGNQADFDSLIDLITSTIAPQTWDSAGGAGSIAPFATGVYVDAEGVLRPALGEDHTGGLAALRRAAAAGENSVGARHRSGLRKVSLSRLERAIQLRLASGQPPTEEMGVLAGLERVKYLLVYPETHDLVLAGPADDWQLDPEGHLVAKTSGHPVVHLDDLVVILRHMHSAPTRNSAARSRRRKRAWLGRGSLSPSRTQQSLPPGDDARDAWLTKLRASLGRQKIEVYGLDPRTRAGRLMVEADYRMKLVGIGLEEGVLGVPSFLSMIEVPKNGALPPLDVLRWWFTLNYDAIGATSEGDAFEIKGQGVKVLSENELLTALGQRVHTGESENLNRDFAHNFTQHFPELAAKYPIYAELQNVFDLALVGGLIRTEHLAERVNWHMLCLADPRQFQVEMAEAPRTVESVINHRIVGGVHILVGVSGGVDCDPTKLVQPRSIQLDYGRLHEERARPRRRQFRGTRGGGIRPNDSRSGGMITFGRFAFRSGRELFGLRLGA